MWEALERAAAAIHQAEHVLAMSNLRSVAPPVEAKRYTRSYGDGVKVQVEDARRVERRKVIGADPHGPLRRKDGADGKSVNTGRRSTDTNRRAVPAPEPDPFEPTEAEFKAFLRGTADTTRQKDFGKAGLAAAFALFGPRYLSEEIHRAVATWRIVGKVEDGWRAMGEDSLARVVHVPSLLRALGDTGSGRPR